MSEQRSPCPRCHVVNLERFLKGRDLLHGVPGEFFLSECQNCSLWYQNPLPGQTQIASFYPDAYTPHGDEMPNVDTWAPVGLRSYIQRHFHYQDAGVSNGDRLREACFF